MAALLCYIICSDNFAECIGQFLDILTGERSILTDLSYQLLLKLISLLTFRTFRTIVSIYIPEIWSSLNGDSLGSWGDVCLAGAFCGILVWWGGFHIFPRQLGKTYAKEYPRILYFENLQMRVSLLFKGGVGLCKWAVTLGDTEIKYDMNTAWLEIS